MHNCEFVTFISILACNIAKDKSPEDLAILSAFFTQLRRYFNYHCYLGFKFRKWLLLAISIYHGL